MGIDKGSCSEKNLGLMRLETLQKSLIESGPDVMFVTEKIGDRHRPAQGKIHAVEVAGFQPGQSERRLAESFARNGSRIDARAAEFVMTIDQGHGLVQGVRA